MSRRSVRLAARLGLAALLILQAVASGVAPATAADKGFAIMGGVAIANENGSTMPGAPIGEIALGITRMKNTTIDHALDAARATDDPAEQIAEWKTVQEQLATENTFVFLVHNEVGEVVANRVHGVTDWTFPDGTKGRPQEQTILSPYQLWIDQ